MADAQIRIDGRIATDPRYNQVNGKDVANLRVLAGRSKKLEDGTWETLSQTAYDVAFWNEHAHLVGAIEPNKGDSVIVTGTVTGVESYAGQNGESLSIKVSGDGVRVFPKQQQSGGGFSGQQQGGNFGGQQAQQSGNWGNQQQAQQSSGWGQNPQGGNGGGPDDTPPF